MVLVNPQGLQLTKMRTLQEIWDSLDIVITISGLHFIYLAENLSFHQYNKQFSQRNVPS